MEGQNLFCDQPNCGDVAYVFGFSSNGTKTKVCQKHILVLTDKQVTVFGVAAFHFVQSAEDGPEYERRRNKMQQGLGNVTSLERICEEDHEKALQQIAEADHALRAVIEQSFRELKERVEKKYRETKQELRDWRKRLEQMVVARSGEPSAVETVLCGTELTTPLFRLALGDCSLQVAEVLATHWHLLPIQGSGLESLTSDLGTRLEAYAKEQAVKGQADVAAEIAIYAQSLGVQCPDFKEEASKQQAKTKARLQMYFPSALTPDQVRELSENILQAAIQARQATNYKKARKKLQRCETFLHLLTLESSSLCLELGLVCSHFAQWSAADNILRRGLELNPPQELALQLSTALAEQYYQAGRWPETVAMSEWTLQTWSSTKEDSALAKALYYLVDSHCYLGHPCAIDWTSRLAETGPACKYVAELLRVEALRLEAQGDEARYEEALSLGEQELREAYLTACARFRLGLLYDEKHKESKAEQHYLDACEVFRNHYPHSLHYANCLNNLSALHCTTRKLDKAVEVQRKASEIYSRHFPLSLECADSLHNLGFVYYLQKQQTQAEESYLKACKLYAQHFPQSLNYPNTLHNLGLLYESCNNRQAATEQYTKALALYSALPSSLEYAHCLNNLGFLAEKAGQKEEALHRLDQAVNIYLEKGDKEGEKRCASALKRIRAEDRI